MSRRVVSRVSSGEEGGRAYPPGGETSAKGRGSPKWLLVCAAALACGSCRAAVRLSARREPGGIPTGDRA